MSATYGKFRAALSDEKAAASFKTGDCWVPPCTDVWHEEQVRDILAMYVEEQYMSAEQANNIYTLWGDLISQDGEDLWN